MKRAGISTSVAAIAIIGMLVTGGVSVYYAFAIRGNGGLSYTGFSLTLTTTTTQAVTVPKGEVAVILPDGVNTSPTLSFEPLNLTLVLGVNSTILFENQDTTEHIIESISWPADTTGFDIFLIQGKTATVQFNATGTYVYNFELNPTSHNGTVTVVSP